MANDTEDLEFIEEDGDDAQKPSSQKRSTAGEFRQQIENLQAELKRERKERLALEKSLGEYRTNEANTTFEKLGLTKGQRELFRKVNPDSPVTEEAVTSFMEEFDLQPPKAGEEPEPQQRQEGFRPTSVPSAAAPGARVYTPVEWDQLRVNNPAEAERALVEGRIRHEAFNPGGPAF